MPPQDWPIEMDAAELEPRPHRLELLDEARNSPQRRVVRDIRLAAPELVVQEHLEAVVGDLAEPFDPEVVRAPGPPWSPTSVSGPSPKSR